MNDPAALYGFLSLLLGIAVYVWIGLSLSAVFAKAGEESWKAWVPVYNHAVLLQLGGFSGWLVLLAFVPIANIAYVVILVLALLRVNRAFGFGAGMTVLGVLLLPVWASIVGWGSARWLGADAAGPLRRGDAAPLDARLAPGYAAPTAYGASAPFAIQPAYGVPPRPPAPAAAPGPGAASGWTPTFDGPASQPAAESVPTPAVAGLPVPAQPGPPVPPPVTTAPVTPADGSTIVPAFRSTARAAAAAQSAVPDPEDADEVDGLDELLMGRSHAPFTQTVPTSFTPPADLAPAPAAPRRAFAPQPGEAPAPVNSFTPVEAGGPASGEQPQAPIAPVQSVPPAPAVPPASDPWAPPSTGGIPIVASRPTRYSPPPDPDAHFDTSAEVSAVVGAPTLGAPRSARESVSAQHGLREIPEVDEGFDETIIAERHRAGWVLTPPLGAPISVTSSVVVIGRRPGYDPDYPDAQLVPISDETRTMSKTHARLELHDDVWSIVDLDSTNGVILIRESGAETDAVPGVAEPLTERFLLGDAELRLARKEGVSRGGGSEAR
jgi:hypothetical protein